MSRQACWLSVLLAWWVSRQAPAWWVSRQAPVERNAAWIALMAVSAREKASMGGCLARMDALASPRLCASLGVVSLPVTRRGMGAQ